MRLIDLLSEGERCRLKGKEGGVYELLGGEMLIYRGKNSEVLEVKKEISIRELLSEGEVYTEGFATEPEEKREESPPIKKDRCGDCRYYKRGVIQGRCKYWGIRKKNKREEGCVIYLERRKLKIKLKRKERKKVE